MPDDAGVVRVDEETGRGVAISTDCNSRFAKLDPYTGAQLALAESYRNVATAGAAPLAVTDCLNFGSPEDPGVMWQFREAVKGIAEGCKTLGIPVTGGNVSFYNQTGDVAIHPTPVIGVLGVMDDVSRRTAAAAARRRHRPDPAEVRRRIPAADRSPVRLSRLGSLRPMGRIVVDVMLKPEILDPQGQAVAGALPRLGFDGITDVRQGKRFVLTVEGEVTDDHLARVREAAETLLSNPVIEDVVSVTAEGGS